MKSLGKISFLILCLLLPELFPQTIEIDKEFEGGNIEVLSVDSINNIISVTPEYKNNDTRASYFYFKVKGFNKSLPLNIRLYTDETYYATEMIAYSINLSDWDRIQAVHQSGYNEFTRIINSDSVYFAIGYPYVYSDIIELVNSIESFSFTEITALTTSENGKDVKLIKITDPNTVDSSKYLIWIIARQHAFETHSNYVIQGLVNFAVSETNLAKRLREQAILYVVPIMDVDNAFDGGTGKDQLPVDFNRDWDSPSYWNAVNAVKQKIVETSSLNEFQFFIDSHNP
jgi:murein tripeptide amidase MpaA